jgi:hypothetical protein
MLEQPPTKKWFDKIRERLSSRNTVIGWLVVLLSAFLWVSDHWDSWTSAWGKIKAMAPILNILTAYAGLPITQILLMVFGFLWIGIAAYLGAKNENLPKVVPAVTEPTVSVSPTATKLAAPQSNPRSLEAADTSEISKIIVDIDRIAAPLQQQEYAKTFVGRSLEFVGSLNQANLHGDAFSMIFDEVKTRDSKPRDPWISVYLPMDENKSLRFAQPGDTYRVTGIIDDINVKAPIIYLRDATVSRHP